MVCQIVTISEADLLWDRGTPHRSLCSLCVVLTISQRLRRCVTAVMGFNTDIFTDCHNLVQIGVEHLCYMCLDCECRQRSFGEADFAGKQSIHHHFVDEEP